MGEGSEWIEASSGENNRSCETHTKNLSRRQKENRGCYTCTLGEVSGGEEERCLDPREACCESRGGLSCLKANGSSAWVKFGGANTESLALPNLQLLLVAQGDVLALVILEF
jgi:hypothetical protein